MAILRRSKYLFAMFRLLLLLHLASSTLALFRGRVYLRVLCFDHPSSTLKSGARCDTDSPCDPEFIFCFYNSTNRDTCNINRTVISFRDSLRLGGCLGPGPQNLPDPLEVSMTTNASDLSLSLTINDIDQPIPAFKRSFLIDELSFRLLPAGLPTLSYGQRPQPKDFGTVPLVSRTSRGRGRPSVQLGAVVQCAQGRFGPLCEVECTATNQFGCFNNGSRRCRPGWAGANCSERDFCAEQPCKPWAICSATPGGFQCSCDGATGPQCLLGGDPCLNHRCVNNASCLGVSGRPVCVCRHGWRGRFCHETDPCVPSPCGANGRCFSRGAALRCDCYKGFSGPACNETEAATEAPETGKPQNAPGKVPGLSTALLLLIIILAVLLVAVVVIVGRCYWQHRRAKDTEQRYPSLSTLSTQRTSPPSSTSVYDESRMTTELRLSAEEGVYEIPGKLYSVKEEEEEEEAGEDTAFQPSRSGERPRDRCGSPTVRFVRA